MKLSELSASGHIPPCEAEDKVLFESVSSFKSQEAREAAIRCASCVLVEACRRNLGELSNLSELNPPTVRSGVYIAGNNARKVVDLFEGDRRNFIDTRVSYERFIDSDNPGEVVTELRKLLREKEITLQGGKGEDRKAEIIGIDLWNIDEEGEAMLRHFKALYQARDKGFLLRDPLVTYEQTIDVVLGDYKELSELTDEVTAAALVCYFSVKDLSELFSLADADDPIPNWMIRRFLHQNRRNPQAALDKYLSNLERLSSHPLADGIPPNILRKLVFENTSDPEGALVSSVALVGELRKYTGNKSATTPGVLTYIAFNNPGSALTTLKRFEGIYNSLLESYEELGLDSTTARLFALNFPDKAHEKALKFTKDFRELQIYFAGQPALTAGKIRKFSRLYDSPKEAIGIYIENVDRLTEQYPDIPSGLIQTISRELHSSDDIIADVSRVREELMDKYAGNPLITGKVIDTTVLNSIAASHRGSPDEEIVLFIQNVESLQAKYGRYYIDIDVLSDIALYHPKNPEKAVTRLLRLMGIVTRPSTTPLSLNKKLGHSSNSAEFGDLIRGGISAEDEYFRIYDRESLLAKVGAILDTLDEESRQQLEVYFGFTDLPDGSMPTDQDIDAILESIRAKKS